MNDDLRSMLANHLHDPRMGVLVNDALRFIDTSTIKSQRLSISSQMSTDVAKLYAFRKKIGVIDPSVRGLDESIACLGEREMDVRLGHVETENGVVAIWLTADQSYPAGIMVLKYMSSLNDGLTDVSELMKDTGIV